MPNRKSKEHDQLSSTPRKTSELSGRLSPEIIFSNSDSEGETPTDDSQDYSESESESDTEQQLESDNDSEWESVVGSRVQSQLQSKYNSDDDGDDGPEVDEAEDSDVSGTIASSANTPKPSSDQIFQAAIMEANLKLQNPDLPEEKLQIMLEGMCQAMEQTLGTSMGGAYSKELRSVRSHYYTRTEKYAKQLRGKIDQQTIALPAEPASKALVLSRANSVAANLAGLSLESSRIPLMLGTRPSLIKEDYTEHEILGSGSFGVVSRVVHKLDRADYALKRIPLTSDSLRANGRGNARLGWARILREVRTLAKLDHVNIVRYYSSWVEDGKMVHEEDGFDDFEQELLRLEQDKPVGPAYPENWPDVIYSPKEEETHEKPRRRQLGKNDRQLTVLSEGQAGFFAPSMPRFAAPHNLTLHIVMALYDMSLREFIPFSADISSGDGPDVYHCHCPRATLSIFRDIVEGVAYLHEKGITHRDLKPANVMLHIEHYGGTTCCKQGKATVVPKITDFGIIENFDPRNPDNVQQPQGKLHGTGKYMPPEGGCHPTVDIWALGIILLELACQFGTGTEQWIWFNKAIPGDDNDIQEPCIPGDAVWDRYGIPPMAAGCCNRDSKQRWSITQIKRQVKDSLHKLQGEEDAEGVSDESVF
ncbi:kinase-like domain-containing protein [Pyronema domesticum]|uniref:Similar to Eukaryotic translation initiation factor 2-alpha kinase 1 acc. no. Q4R8E0 n=1 Tax=Pyronema omphalodes (strain CBS 100304) TaxID=1076935 RepID=U4LJL0_PYROM|nr:kinase-like domain-containing protein [Pyronema domesticum]CCX31742.1 Similar to Eukaryotic translation initiation factor 2-alpha kinase 1; acc. no. Q4R8E0 [Pyronema omphalodes CBS 100304]